MDAAADIARSGLAATLRREIAGDVLFGPADRGRYATDASIYQVMPVGVIVPERVEDVEAALSICREHDVPVLPRGGGTSQCGQTVNRALVIDCSKHLRRLLHFDPDRRTALVEPGIVLSQLNQALQPHGLFFPVDPSTHARCTLGGMAGNNSCGAKSIRYGLMADNVAAIDAILADGTRHRFGPLADNLGEDVSPSIAALVQRLRALGAAEADEIEARLPKQLRSVGGYNIQALTPGARAHGRANLARLLVGSEGTLAFSAAIELMLQPIKPRKALGVCQFPTFRAAMAATRHLVTLDPEAVELVDRTMIDLGRAIAIYQPTIERMVIGRPDSVLIVEFHGHDDAALLAKLSDLDAMMGDLGFPGAVVRAIDPAFQADIAAVREAGLNIMMSMKGDAKPVSFIEDCAVALDDLADFTEQLNELFERHGTSGTWYAHASVGCLHVRPVLNMKDPLDVAKMRTVAEECFALVRRYKGSHSGEHGDGILRSEFHEPMFGPHIARAFETVKDAFDPAGLLNPNRMVRSPRMDDRSLFRYPPGYAADPNISPRLDWSAWPGPLGGMLGAAEMCNNNGACRTFDVGVMCPSYRVTRDETHSTRGRANTLRLAFTGQLGPDALSGAALAESMKLCVSCKACRRECPTGVDIAKFKLEVLAAQAERNGVRLRERLVAELPRLGRIASRAPALANLRNRVPALRRIGERIGLAAERSLPEWRADAFRDEEARDDEPHRRPATRDVVLLADTFNRYFEPENLRAALRVLRAAGVRAVLPNAPGGRPLCCGRTYLSAGMLDRARAEARRTLHTLRSEGADGLPVIGLEPSCLFTLKDEFPALLPGADARDLAQRTMLLSEFLVREVGHMPFRPLAATAHVHGHCHQKSFGAFPAALAALKRIPELTVGPIAASCCGMAGAFGYQSETLAVSKSMGEASLLPAVRAAGEGDLVVADGFSCRHQIRDLAGREAIHSVHVLELAL